MSHSKGTTNESAIQIPFETIDLSDLASRTPYAPEAFLFVQQGLRVTVQRVHGDVDPVNENGEVLSTHVSGRDLCLGLRDLAVRRYGLLARRVLEHWNVHRTDDFGRIVFTMIEAGLMSSQPEDRLDDFFGVYPFNEAFAPERVMEQLALGSGGRTGRRPGGSTEGLASLSDLV